MKLGDVDPHTLIPALNTLAETNGYTKIFTKLPSDAASVFANEGYVEEAEIPGCYNGSIDARFMCRYIDETRAQSPQAAEIREIIQLSKDKATSPYKPLPDNKSLAMRPCTPEDTPRMSHIYSKVFPSYPFPIDNPDYLRDTMKTHIAYFGVEYEGELIALSSAEMDEANSNVEMTDFATLPHMRGKSLAVHLLSAMERAMQQRGIKTAYTIARAISPGMNITFARKGYHFGGTLINNTNISGQIESMNVWYKTC